ncbi:flavin monoamine oxidase family protein [Paucibacter soli]|uniref:flavin monoamine oxidase family protein n=1 Tax=Paucibacter soli TaxID=3133433 RepID=UPI0030B61095
MLRPASTPPQQPTRRAWLQRLGRVAGSGAVYAALAQLGLAQASPARADFGLGRAPTGARVLVLGAGLAGLVSAHELQRAGYRVQLLEYQARPGGRCWTLRGGDRYTELGGASQRCEFAPGEYFNPGPWRIPYHHHGVLGYCKRLGVALQPFIQINQNAYVHGKKAFGGRPQRWRELQADFQGQVSELLAKVVQQQRLDEALSNEDQARLLEALRSHGALDAQGRYRAGEIAAERRGFAGTQAGAGVSAGPPHEQPLGLHDLLDSGLMGRLDLGSAFEYQMPLFQPVGGMDAIARALAKAVGPRIRYGARVTEIQQDERGVTAHYETLASPGQRHSASADWCVCTLPLSVLSQLEMRISPALRAAIDAVSYFAALKVGLQFKRRFWEEDEGIYGGISSTDLAIRTIGYPSHHFHARKGVLLGAYAFGANAYEFSALPPAERVREALRLGAQIHPQYPAEFEHGMAVAWHRHPATLGCFAAWTQAARERHYPQLLQMDGRLILAGEHASLLPAWQEGAVLSAQHAVTQLHARASA